MANEEAAENLLTDRSFMSRNENVPDSTGEASKNATRKTVVIAEPDMRDLTLQRARTDLGIGQGNLSTFWTLG